MTFNRNELLYLQDIQDAINKINIFIEKMSYDEFIKDEKTQYAVIRALEIIGEASKKINQGVKEVYSELPWREMSGMRDKLIHDYFGVNTEVIWKTASEDIPNLYKKLNEIIKHFK
ncbi:MAG: DUF86 domain-containing protein [Calditrichota bacterium]|jgi:uncharacterized protein with HEPN domain